MRDMPVIALVWGRITAGCVARSFLRGLAGYPAEPVRRSRRAVHFIKALLALGGWTCVDTVQSIHLVAGKGGKGSQKSQCKTVLNM